MQQSRDLPTLEGGQLRLLLQVSDQPIFVRFFNMQHVYQQPRDVCADAIFQQLWLAYGFGLVWSGLIERRNDFAMAGSSDRIDDERAAGT